MNDPAFLAALVDSFVPGGSFANAVNMPSASEVGGDRALAEALARADSRLGDLVELIAIKAGGAEAFAAASQSSRAAVLQQIQAEKPAKFAELVTLVLSHFYAQPQALNGI